MKKSELKKLIKEEIKNALTEAEVLKINSNPNVENDNQRGFEDTTVNTTTRADRDTVFNGVEITQPGSGGNKTVFIPSSEFPKLISFLQGLNLEPFTTEDAELNPSLVKMVKRIGKR